MIGHVEMESYPQMTIQYNGDGGRFTVGKPVSRARGGVTQDRDQLCL